VEHAALAWERDRAMTDDAYALGMRVRRDVLGDAQVDRSLEETTEFTAAFQDLITRYAWGAVWGRDGLDRRTRSVITLAILTALGRDDEIALHVRAALRNGLAVAEISQLFLHAAVYAGVPAARHAYTIAQRVLDEEGAGEGRDGPPPGERGRD
jgi:4-carboxymuconolactone decarboxylase